VIHLNESGNQITERRKEIRAGLVGLAVPVLIVGGWALIAPHNWYENFPIGDAHWISSLGAYQEHLVRDFGSLYLALGLLLLFSAVMLDRLLVQAILGASLVFQVPHFIFHASNTEPFSTTNNVVNLVLLAAGLLLTAMLLSMTSRRKAAPAAAQEPTKIEGGIVHGTR
jgi:hypothetical protein